MHLVPKTLCESVCVCVFVCVCVRVCVCAWLFRTWLCARLLAARACYVGGLFCLARDLFDFAGMAASAAGSSAAAEDTVEEDLAWLDELEESYRRDRALERLVADASTAVHVDVAPAVAVSSLDRLPEVVVGVLDVADGPCPICLEDICVGDLRTTLPCVHLFHSTCVKTWLAGSDRCPVCQGSVSAGLGVSALVASLRRSAPSSSTSGEPSQDVLRERRLALRFRGGTESRGRR